MDNTFCSESSGAPAKPKPPPKPPPRCPIQRLEINPTLHSEFDKYAAFEKLNNGNVSSAF